MVLCLVNLLETSRRPLGPRAWGASATPTTHAGAFLLPSACGRRAREGVGVPRGASLRTEPSRGAKCAQLWLRSKVGDDFRVSRKLQGNATLRRLNHSVELAPRDPGHTAGRRSPALTPPSLPFVRARLCKCSSMRPEADAASSLPCFRLAASTSCRRNTSNATTSSWSQWTDQLRGRPIAADELSCRELQKVGGRAESTLTHHWETPCLNARAVEAESNPHDASTLPQTFMFTTLPFSPLLPSAPAPSPTPP